MVNEAEIKELLKHSAPKIKGNKALFSDFIRLYVANGGSPNACMGCNFNTTYNKWKRDIIKPKKVIEMSNKTFKLKNENKTYPILRESFVFSKHASDEEAIYWINHPSGDAEKRKLEFSKLPNALLEEKKEVKSEQKKRRKSK